MHPTMLLGKCFQIQILMCFLHVKFNCKKNYQNYGLTLDDWNSDIEKDIDLLHCSMSLAEFELRKKRY